MQDLIDFFHKIFQIDIGTVGKDTDPVPQCRHHKYHRTESTIGAGMIDGYETGIFMNKPAIAIAQLVGCVDPDMGFPRGSEFFPASEIQCWRPFPVDQRPVASENSYTNCH